METAAPLRGIGSAGCGDWSRAVLQVRSEEHRQGCADSPGLWLRSTHCAHPGVTRCFDFGGAFLISCWFDASWLSWLQEADLEGGRNERKRNNYGRKLRGGD